MKKFYELGKNTLYPICRSLTGDGFRKSLNIIKSEFPQLKIKKIKSGTKVFDWNIPEEWNVSGAHVLDKNNNKIIDFKENNLHVIGYSTAIEKNLKLEELKKHLHTQKNLENAIPYITSYYKKNWGFNI